jgi:cytochrome d ubiquinol oxidase subunit II
MIIFENGEWLPLTFAFLMGFSMLVYAILDGYDLGVGVLVSKATPAEKDIMISSIGPFWDANETWLVLGVGLLLVAFPMAHGMILTNLYLPVAFMLIGLILRGVAFDFRVKAKSHHKDLWNLAFFAGSFLAAFAQGYMLGSYILGFESSLEAFLFSVLVGFSLVAGYVLIGASWLIMKTEGDLQKKSVGWARIGLYGTVLGIGLVSISTPWVSERIFDKWFGFPNIIYLSFIPLLTGIGVLFLERFLKTLPRKNDSYAWVPFVSTVVIYVLCFSGLAFSFYPYIVPEKLKIVEAASAPESLKIILVGALVVLPALVGYTFLAYKIFHGKAKELTYGE